MITDFVSTAIVIDDKQDEVNGLIPVLEKEDITVQYFKPDDLSGVSFKKNRQLIFLDLSLDDSRKITDNIAFIRTLFGNIISKGFGTYGIVVWSKHQEDIDFLKEKLQIDKENNSYPAPLFIVGLDKTKYKTAGNFDTLCVDIETILKQDAAATFFLEWTNSIRQAHYATISRIYSLIPDYRTFSDDFKCILETLALNHTGIKKSQANGYPLHIDAFKSFDDIFHAELINCQKSGTNLFGNSASFSKPENSKKIQAQLNTALVIDENNIDQNIVIPGNVYEIKNNGSKLLCDTYPNNITKIAFEITPPCDFANPSARRRVRARLIGGFLIKAEDDIKKQIKTLQCTKECFYSDFFPIMISGNADPQLLVLDFRYLGSEEDVNLQNANKYKILFRAKPKFFADVLQKFSSHAARLGLSVIHEIS